MSGFFRGPSLFTHVFVCALGAAVLGGLTFDAGSNQLVSLTAAGVWALGYAVFASLVAFTEISLKVLVPSAAMAISFYSWVLWSVLGSI